jgi:spoIIIJ-associated protein
MATLIETRNAAEKVLCEILSRMGMDAEVSAFDDSERVILDAYGPDSALIIGKKGATLDALQYLLNRIVGRNVNEGPSIVVDAEGYRGQRADTLAEIAQRLAAKALQDGRPVAAEPMNAHDRRLVHVALADNPDVTTESEGEGPSRRVVVFPAKAAS